VALILQFSGPIRRPEQRRSKRKFSPALKGGHMRDRNALRRASRRGYRRLSEARRL
jgi:hypothetical protein